MELNIILWIITFLILALIICLWKIADRVTRLEALVKLLENEIKLIHEKDGDTEWLNIRYLTKTRD